MNRIKDLSDKDRGRRLTGVWTKTEGPHGVGAPTPPGQPATAGHGVEGDENGREGSASHRQTAVGDGVLNAEKPLEASPGRDTGGKFTKGNKYSCGNPFGRKLAELRTALIAAVTPEDMRQIAEGLVKRARTGYLPIVKLLLLYTIGRPAEAVNPDRVDLDEWQLLDAQPTKSELMRAVFDGIPAELAVKLIHIVAANRVEAPDAADKVIKEFENVSVMQGVLDERKKRRKKG